MLRLEIDAADLQRPFRKGASTAPLHSPASHYSEQADDGEVPEHSIQVLRSVVAGDRIRIKADDEWLETKALIIASGASHPRNSAWIT